MQEMQETQVQPLGWEDPLQEELASRASVLAWRIPGTERPGGLLSQGCKEADTPEQLNPHSALLR